MAAVHESTNSSLNERCQFVDQGPRLARSKGYGGFLSRALIGEQTARGDSDRGAALRMVAWPVYGGGSPEFAAYGASDLSFQ
jgi:hypothetical protein